MLFLIKLYAIIAIGSASTHLIPSHYGEWFITVLAHVMSIAVIGINIFALKSSNYILPSQKRLLRVKYATLYQFSGWLHIAVGFAFWLILLPSLLNGKWDDPLFFLGFFAVFGTANGVMLLYKYTFLCIDQRGVYTYSPLNSSFTDWSAFKEVILTSSTITLKKHFSFKVPLAIEIYNSDSSVLDNIPSEKISNHQASRQL